MDGVGNGVEDGVEHGVEHASRRYIQVVPGDGVTWTVLETVSGMATGTATSTRLRRHIPVGSRERCPMDGVRNDVDDGVGRTAADTASGTASRRRCQRRRRRRRRGRRRVTASGAASGTISRSLCRNGVGDSVVTTVSGTAPIQRSIPAAQSMSFSNAAPPRDMLSRPSEGGDPKVLDTFPARVRGAHTSPLNPQRKDLGHLEGTTLREYGLNAKEVAVEDHHHQHV